MAVKKSKKDRELSLKRAEVIIKVRAKQMTATDGAVEMNVSRKTYYELEERALDAMLNALARGKPGRPRKEVDQEKEALKKRIKELEAELKAHHVALTVRETLAPVIPDREDAAKEMKRKTAVKKKGRQKR